MSDEPAAKKRKENESTITTKSGGAYIPPAKLRLMQQQITDKSSEEYQRLSWEALKKSLNGLINKVNVSNIKDICKELFQENLVRGRGVLARAIIMAQNASPTFTHVYASLTAVINSRFPQNGELILRRVAAQFRRAYRRNLKDTCLHSVQFIAHLTNQQVAHEILGLQILTLLLETPTDDSVEVAIGFIKEAGQKLSEVSPRGLTAVFERLRHILHEQQLEKRVQYMIEVLFAIRKDGFKEHPSLLEDLDLVDESDQYTHMLTLDDDSIRTQLETQLNVFRFDPNFEKTEENYKQIKKDILAESSEGSESSGDESSSEESDEEEDDEAKMEIKDKTETNLVALRRTVYLAIQSSLSFDECAHKILKMEFGEQDYGEICAMIVDCCSQLRTYEKFFGLLGGRFCMLKKEFMEQFEILFAQQYETIHRLETNKLRNVAKFFAHLLHSDAIPWSVLSNIKLSEDTTTSSSRIFIKILFQEITEYIGITKLNERLKDPTLAPFFEGIFPKDDPRSTRFAINFFTSIGLGGITDDLRQHLKTTAQLVSQKLQEEQLAALNTDSDSSDSDDEDSSSSEEVKKKKKKASKSKKKKALKKKRKRRKSSSSSDKSWYLESDGSEDEVDFGRLRSTVNVVNKEASVDPKLKDVEKETSKKKKDFSDSDKEEEKISDSFSRSDARKPRRNRSPEHNPYKKLYEQRSKERNKRPKEHSLSPAFDKSSSRAREVEERSLSPPVDVDRRRKDGEEATRKNGSLSHKREKKSKHIPDGYDSSKDDVRTHQKEERKRERGSRREKTQRSDDSDNERHLAQKKGRKKNERDRESKRVTSLSPLRREPVPSSHFKSRPSSSSDSSSSFSSDSSPNRNKNASKRRSPVRQKVRPSSSDSGSSPDVQRQSSNTPRHRSPPRHHTRYSSSPEQRRLFPASQNRSPPKRSDVPSNRTPPSRKRHPVYNSPAKRKRSPHLLRNHSPSRRHRSRNLPSAQSPSSRRRRSLSPRRHHSPNFTPNRNRRSPSSSPNRSTSLRRRRLPDISPNRSPRRHRSPSPSPNRSVSPKKYETSKLPPNRSFSPQERRSPDISSNRSKRRRSLKSPAGKSPLPNANRSSNFFSNGSARRRRSPRNRSPPRNRNQSPSVRVSCSRSPVRRFYISPKRRSPPSTRHRESSPEHPSREKAQRSFESSSSESSEESDSSSSPEEQMPTPPRKKKVGKSKAAPKYQNNSEQSSSSETEESSDDSPQLRGKISKKKKARSSESSSRSSDESVAEKTIDKRQGRPRQRDIEVDQWGYGDRNDLHRSERGQRSRDADRRRERNRVSNEQKNSERYRQSDRSESNRRNRSPPRRHFSPDSRSRKQIKKVDRVDRSPTPPRSYQFVNDDDGRKRIKDQDRMEMSKRPVSYNSDTENKRGIRRRRSAERARRSVSSENSSLSRSPSPVQRNRRSRQEEPIRRRR